MLFNILKYHGPPKSEIRLRGGQERELPVCQPVIRGLDGCPCELSMEIGKIQ